VIDAWTHANNDIAEAMVSTMRKSKGGSTRLFMMFDSGSRGFARPDPQLAGMRGLMAKPQKKADGGIRRNHREPDQVELPRRAVGVDTSSRRTARGRVSPTPRSRRPDAGYLTRRQSTWRRNVTITERRLAVRSSARDVGVEGSEDISSQLRDAGRRGLRGARKVMDPHELDEDAGPEVLVEAGKLNTRRPQQAIGTRLEMVKIRSGLDVRGEAPACAACATAATSPRWIWWTSAKGRHSGRAVDRRAGDPADAAHFHIGVHGRRVSPQQTVRRRRSRRHPEHGDRLRIVKKRRKDCRTSYERAESEGGAPTAGRPARRPASWPCTRLPGARSAATLMSTTTSRSRRTSVNVHVGPYYQPDYGRMWGSFGYHRRGDARTG